MSDCNEHLRLERDLAATMEAVHQLREIDTHTAQAIDRFDVRLRNLEAKAAKYAGGIAALAAIPALVKVIEILIPAARAAIGG